MIVTFNSLVLAAASCGFLQTCQWSLVSAAIPSRSRWSRTNSVPWKERSACWTMHLNVAVVSFQVFFFFVLWNSYKPKTVHSVRYYTVYPRCISRMGSLWIIHFSKHFVFFLLMNSFNDRSVSFHLPGTI